MNGLGDRELIGALVTILVASYTGFFAWVVASIKRLDRKIEALDSEFTARFDAEIGSLSTRLEAKSDSLGARLDTKIDSIDDRLSNEIKSLDSRLSSKVDALGTKVDLLTVAVARLEGAVWAAYQSNHPRVELKRLRSRCQKMVAHPYRVCLIP
jgi:hypothetical protein